MFITDYGYTVSQSDFYDIVTKYQSREDINYYIDASRPYTENFFEPATNLEVMTLQHIVWNKSKSNEANDTAFNLYIEGKSIEKDTINLLKVDPVPSTIVDHYNNCVVLGSKTTQTKNKIKRFMRTINNNPLFGGGEMYGYFTNHNFYIINNMYYNLRDLDSVMKFELRKVKKNYIKHKQDTMVSTILCFNYNFGLPFNLQIHKTFFINQIESFLF